MTTLTYPPVPLYEILRATAARYADRTAVVFEDRTLTFAEIDAESNRLARGLRDLGLGAGDRLGIFLPNCPEFEIAFYAASKLGAVACPLNSAYREREITYQLNDSGARALITHAKLWPVVESALPRLASTLSVVLVGDDAPDSASNVIRCRDVVAGQS